jgi:hypothetical protein
MADTTVEAADKNVEIWKVKKLIKSLEAARGNGTSMISLIIPPGKCCTLGCLRFRHFLISEVWKVANCVILVMESNRKKIRPLSQVEG